MPVCAHAFLFTSKRLKTLKTNLNSVQVCKSKTAHIKKNSINYYCFKSEQFHWNNSVIFLVSYR